MRLTDPCRSAAIFGMQTVAAALLTLIVATRAFAADAPSVYKTAIIDGQNNHDWRSTTPMIKTALEKTGRFQVAVLTSPPTADAAAWKDFHPRFSDYDLIVSNFTDFGAKPAPAAFLDDLTKHVGDGGGIVIVHAATSGMDNHAEFVRMVGMGWRDGDRLYLDNDGQTIRQPKGQGPATAHGRPFRWTVTTWAKDHPICAGLPLAKLAGWFGSQRVIRVMPNTPLMVGEGDTVFTCGARGCMKPMNYGPPHVGRHRRLRFSPPRLPPKQSRMGRTNRCCGRCDTARVACS